MLESVSSNNHIPCTGHLYAQQSMAWECRWIAFTVFGAVGGYRCWVPLFETDLKKRLHLKFLTDWNCNGTVNTVGERGRHLSGDNTRLASFTNNIAHTSPDSICAVNANFRITINNVEAHNYAGGCGIRSGNAYTARWLSIRNIFSNLD